MNHGDGATDQSQYVSTGTAARPAGGAVLNAGTPHNALRASRLAARGQNVPTLLSAPANAKGEVLSASGYPMRAARREAQQRTQIKRERLALHATGGGPVMDYLWGATHSLRTVPHSRGAQAAERQSDREPTGRLSPTHHRPTDRCAPPTRPSPAGCPRPTSSGWRIPRSEPTSGYCREPRQSPRRSSPARTS